MGNKQSAAKGGEEDLLSCVGRIDLSRVSYTSLVGRTFKDGFDDDPLCELEHGELVVKVVPPDERLALKAAESFMPNISARMVENKLGVYRFKVDHGLDLIELVEALGGADFADGVREEAGLGVKVRDASSSNSSDCRDWSKPLHTDRRLRIWVPRLKHLCWVWQRAADGAPLIRWGALPGTTKGSDGRASWGGGHGQGASPFSTDDFQLAPTAEFVVVQEDAIPADLVHQLHEGLDRLCGPWDPEVPFAGDGDGCSDEEVDHVATTTVFRVGRSPVTRDAATYAKIIKGVPQKQALFSARVNRRDRCWRDLIDPELCLCQVSSVKKEGAALVAAPSELDDADFGANLSFESQDEGEVWQLQAFEMDVDADGGAHWASWLHHLDEGAKGGDSALKDALASLFAVALPHLEAACGLRLRAAGCGDPPRRLQVVVRSYEQVLKEDEEAKVTEDGYKISDWHVDGTKEEHLVATAVCYLEMSGTLEGGHLVIAQDKKNRKSKAGFRGFSQGTGTFSESTGTSTGSSGPYDTDTDDEGGEESGWHVVVRPRTGTVVAFDNIMVQHKVGRLTGYGRRRIVAFNVVHPDHRQLPERHLGSATSSASARPRRLRAAAALDAAVALIPLNGRFPARPLRLVCAFAVCDRLSSDAATLLARRDCERNARLRVFPQLPPRQLVRQATGTFNRRDLRTTGTFDRGERRTAVTFNN